MVRIGVLTKERDKARMGREELRRMVGFFHEHVLDSERILEIDSYRNSLQTDVGQRWCSEVFGMVRDIDERVV